MILKKKFRTKKVPQVLIKYEATDKHPAQTEVYHDDVNIGTIEVVHKSGRLTPAQKSKLMGNIDLFLAKPSLRNNAPLPVTRYAFFMPIDDSLSKM